MAKKRASKSKTPAPKRATGKCLVRSDGARAGRAGCQVIERWSSWGVKARYPLPRIEGPEDPLGRVKGRGRVVDVWARVVDALEAGPVLSDQLIAGFDHGNKRLTTLLIDRLNRKAAAAKRSPYRHNWPRGYRFVAELNYPLARPVCVHVEPYTVMLPRRGMVALPRSSVGWILWSLAKGYEYVYRHAEEFGVWGHDIGDLCFERLTFYEDGRIRVGVGS